MHAAWSATVPCHLCGTLPAAAAAARRDAAPGDTILLAPGCTSYDQFPSYAARGDAFRALATAPESSQKA
jgi:UDP-N-acetylmuramoylalanine--D-glutamate ligase